MSFGIIRIEHIGVAIDSPDQSSLFTTLFDRPIYKTEEVESERVRTHFFQLGQSKIELLEGLGDDAISRFIDKRGPGIHHIAFEVEDIHRAFEHAKAIGMRVLNDAPKQGADNKLIFFIHPKSTGGILVEFCQENDAH